MMQASSRNFRINNSSVRKKNRATSSFKKTLTEQYKDKPAVIYKKAALSEHRFSVCDQDTNYNEIKALKETTQIALEGLLQVRRNKQLLRDLKEMQPEIEDSEGKPKLDFISKLDRLRQVMNMQINDLRVYNDKIDQLERYSMKRVKTENGGKANSDSRTKQPDLDDSTSPIKEDPFLNSQILLPPIKKGSMQDINPRAAIPSVLNRFKVSVSEGQRSNVSRENSGPISEIEIKSPDLKDPEPLRASARLENSGFSSLNDLQNIFFSSYHAFRLELKQIAKDPITGTTNCGSILLQYCFKMTYRKSDASYTYGLAVNRSNFNHNKSQRMFSEPQFIALSVALLKDQDNYLNFTADTPFAVILKHCILSKIKVVA